MRTWPSRFALSQIIEPGVVRPRMPTFTGLLPFTFRVTIV